MMAGGKGGEKRGAAGGGGGASKITREDARPVVQKKKEHQDRSWSTLAADSRWGLRGSAEYHFNAHAQNDPRRSTGPK